VLAGNQGNRVPLQTCAREDDTFVYRWPVAEAMRAELALSGSRIAAAARRQQRDAAVSGAASGSTQLPADTLASPPPGLRQGLDAARSDVSWAKAALDKVFDFAAFVGVHWRWIALGVAAWYGLRFLYDSHMIGLWRAEDHNQGPDVVPELRTGGPSTEEAVP
jgi:hypothetical protein